MLERLPQLPTVARDAYEVAGKFAQGGIGRILRAHDPVLGRTVALKELLVAGTARRASASSARSC
jgi:hypothetical protein